MKGGTRWLILLAVMWIWAMYPWDIQAQQYAFRQYGVEAGVPIAHALAFDVYQTMLVGTNDGLYRFDGRIFDAVTLPGVGETAVQRMIAGPDGKVWAVADPNRLFLIDGVADPVEIEVPAALREGLAAGTWYQRLRTDPAGRLWLNDTAAGLWRYDAASGHWMDSQLPGVREVTDFFFEDAETLWLADTDRVGRLWLEGERLGEVEWLVEVPRVVYIRPHPAGAWIGTREGLFLMTRWGTKRQVLGPEYVAWWYSKPDVDRTGRLFTCLEHNYRLGVYRLGPDGTIELQAEEGSNLRDAKALQLLFDDEGGSWFANTSGLTHLEQEYLVSFPVMAPDGTPEVVKDLVPGPLGGPPWVATWGGLYTFENNSLKRISVMPRSATSRPATDRDGHVWWNDQKTGAFTYRHGQKSRAVGSGTFRLYDASDGTRYYSTDAGTFKESNGKMHKIGQGGWREMLAAETGDDFLWIRAEWLDVVVGDSLGSTCKMCLPPSVRAILKTFEQIPIVEMYPDGLGRIWAVTLTENETLRGLICIYRKADGTWTYKHFGKEVGMLDHVSSLFPTPDGRLWVGTWRGIQAFSVTPGEPELTPLFQLRARDGLDGENIEALVEDDQGFLWIGCTAGKLHRLDYRRMARLSSPSSYIAQMERDGLTTPVTEAPLRLRANASRLAIRLAAQTYRLPRQVHFQYRLLPGDTTWVDLKTARSVQFPLLPAGSYHFEARAVREGSTPGPSIMQALTVVPPFYRRWWFVAMVGGLCCMPFIAWHRNRLDKRLAVEKLRLRIATDLHDDIGSGLTEVSLYSELIRRAAQGEAAQWATQVGEMARHLLDAMRDIVWAINPELESWEALELRMKDYAASLLFPQDIQFEMTGEMSRREPPLSVDVRRNVLLIFKEALHNAVRHARCQRVEVQWRLTPYTLWLQISDDGAGFDASRACSGNGMANLRRRAQEIGADLTLETGPGAGTKIKLSVPLQ